MPPERSSMAKVDKKIHEYRMSGASWILDIVKKDGIEAAENELKRRGADFIPMEINNDALKDFETRVKGRTIDTICLLSAVTLRDEFGFGKDRLRRFVERFNEKADCLGDDYVTWGDMIEQMKEETGIDFDIRKNGE